MITRRRSAAVVAAAVGLLVLSGCPADPGVGPGPTTTLDPGQNRAPVISAFTATRPSGASPVTTPLLWTISDPDGQPLTCTLDLDQNGTQDRTVPNCTSSSVRSATSQNGREGMPASSSFRTLHKSSVPNGQPRSNESTRSVTWLGVQT